MPDDTQLSVGAIIDATGVSTGANQVANSVDQMAAKVRAAFGSVEKAPEGIQNALKVLANSARQSGAIVTDSINTINAALEETPAAATAAGTSLDRALTTASARLLSTEAGLGRMGLALTRVGVASGALGPILAAAFPVLAIVGIVSLISSLTERFDALNEKIRQNIIEEENLADSAALTADKLRLEGIQIQDHIDKIEKHPETNRLADALIETKIRAEELAESLQKDVDKSVDLFDTGFWGALFSGGNSISEGVIKGQLRPFLDAVQAAKNEVAQAPAGDSGALNKALNDEKAAYKDLADNIQAWIKTVDPNAIDTIAKLRSAYSTASSALKSLSLEQENNVKRTKEAQDVINNETKKQTDSGVKHDDLEAAREELEKLERIAAIKKKGDEETKKDDEEAARSDLELIDRRLQAEKKAIEEARRINQEKTASDISTAKYQMQLADETATHEKTIGELTAQQELQAKLSALAKERDAELAAVGSEIGKLNPDDPNSPAGRQKLYGQLIQIQQNYVLQSTRLTEQMAEQQLGQFTQLFNQLNQPFISFVNSVTTGNERISQDFRKLGLSILSSVVESLTKLALQTAEYYLIQDVLQQSSIARQIAAIATGNAAKHGVTVETNVADATSAAGVAAAGAFSSAMIALPFPVNIATAPEVAAGALATGLGFAAIAAQESGGMTGSSTGLVMMHPREITMPADVSSAFRNIVAAGGNPGEAAGGGGGASITFAPTVHAMDAAGVDRVLQKHSKTFQKNIKSWLRNGSIK